MLASVHVDVFTLQAEGGFDVGCRHGDVLASCDAVRGVQFNVPQPFNKPELRIRFLPSLFTVTVNKNRKNKNNNSSSKSAPWSTILLEKKLFLG